MDIASLKLADLKRELRERGLSTTGAKQVLVDRLAEAISAEKASADDSNIDDDLLDEDSMLDDEESDADGEVDESVAADLTISSPTVTVAPTSLPSASPTKNPPEPIKRTIGSPQKTGHNGACSASEVDGGPPAKKKVILNRQPVPDAAPQVLAVATAESIAAGKAATENKPPEGDKSTIKLSEGTTLDEPETDKLKLRQQKFGSSSTTSAGQPASVTGQISDKLQKRAERFGSTGGGTSAAGKVQLTTEDELKLARRKERFGIPAEEKLGELKEKRAARFGTTTNAKPSVVSTAEVEDKKRLRAARFAAAL